MSNAQRSLSLFAGWVTANAVGWAAGLAGGFLLTFVASRLAWLNEDHVFAYAALISLGISSGTAQWVVIRDYLPRPGQWIAATVAGYLLCLAIVAGGNLIGAGQPGLWDDVALLALCGAAVGAAQWWVLRATYPKAGLWVPATAAGFFCFVWLIIDPAHLPGELVMRGTIIGALAAVVPGAALVWLTHWSALETPSELS